MAPRLDLQAVLSTILPGPKKVSFQPPENLVLDYPCIVYNLDDGRTTFAGNKPYNYRKRYQVTVIDRNPDTVIPDKIAMLPMCTFDRYFAADKLHHYVFNIFF